jgi:N-acyl-D-amino-acid deacylase
MPSAAEDMANGFRAMLMNVERANAEGCRMTTQVFTRPQGILMCWESRSHPFTESPTFESLWRSTKDPTNGLFKGKSILSSDKGIREQIINETLALTKQNNEIGYYGLVPLRSTDDDGPGNLNATVTSLGALPKMYLNNAKFVFKWDGTYEPKPEMSAEAEANRRNTSPLHVIYDWLCEQNGSQVVTYLFMAYAKRNLDDLYEQLTHPLTVPGLGDTGAHIGFLSDPTSPTYLLTHWHRDRITGPRFPLEFAVKLHTSDTAKIFSLEDRGVLQVGKVADFNVINLEKLKIHPPKFVRDLPKGAARWIQEVSGYDYTIKSGVITFENGIPTGKLPGRLIDGPGYDPTYVSNGVTQLGSSLDDSGIHLKLSKLKWEAEQKFLEGLLYVLGAERLEKIGAFITERMPLKASKL